jgi:hypothetical protein
MKKLITRLALTAAASIVILLNTMAVLAQGPAEQQPD